VILVYLSADQSRLKKVPPPDFYYSSRTGSQAILICMVNETDGLHGCPMTRTMTHYNPKVGFFFLSFLPQFIQIGSPLYKLQPFFSGIMV
jgi:hypothetical protein